MGTYVFRRGEAGFNFDSELVDEAGVPADLTGATVTFRLDRLFQTNRHRQGRRVINVPAVVVGEATAGKVLRTLSASDLGTRGTFTVSWEARWPDGRRRVYPRVGTPDRIQVLR